ncbi:GP46-like surface antigen, putative [Bodo saltans]|uniref:GP46-like surface antigen, putative n=1 Tax=Bodo saltans TaxID=75058 RepID=A0A0S4JB24_BODSA|nr:GP46-like surface antigen, putative [Bodo saltans]|eukprot:CUG88588.1 GP46-like surface antigen, putative [Bodo saltans]
MNGLQWKSKWNFSDPDAPCVFPGVTCDLTDITIITDVTKINLGQQGLSGQLRAGICSLTKITLFNVSFNGIAGTLPREYAAWASINELFVDS